MEEFEKSKESVFQIVAKKFEKIYGAELSEVSYDDLPQYVSDYFKAQASALIPEDSFDVEHFDRLCMFTHENGDVTYIGEEDKTYELTSGSTERLTYFVDTRDGAITGYLEMRLSLTDDDAYFKDKPFVGYTRTLEEFKKTGLALRRLEEANAYSISVHGFPLNSDTLMSEEAQNVWLRLVALGKAEQYDEEGNVRFRFIVQTD